MDCGPLNYMRLFWSIFTEKRTAQKRIAQECIAQKCTAQERIAEKCIVQKYTAQKGIAIETYCSETFKFAQFSSTTCSSWNKYLLNWLPRKVLRYTYRVSLSQHLVWCSPGPFGIIQTNTIAQADTPEFPVNIAVSFFHCFTFIWSLHTFFNQPKILPRDTASSGSLDDCERVSIGGCGMAISVQLTIISRSSIWR